MADSAQSGSARAESEQKATRQKWDNAAKSFDLVNGLGPELRWAPVKRELFSAMQGKILFLAVGTGLDIQFFPPGHDIIGIDISPKMLEKAGGRSAAYPGHMRLQEMDVHEVNTWSKLASAKLISCTSISCNCMFPG